MAAKNKANEIYLERIYDAPVKTLWDAWVDPEKVAKWWGPRGFTLTSHSKDVRTGGHWNYTMHGPDGVDWPNSTQYLEVEKYSRMVYDHGGNATQPPMFRVTVNFIELGKKTKMEMTMALATAEAAQETKKFIKKAGGDSTWDRLAEYLAPTDKFFINRSFAVDINKMFEAWVDPKQLGQWMGPTGSTMNFIRADIKTGGSSFYKMEMGAMVMYGSCHYKEITKPTKIVYTQNFCDENEKMARHPASPSWPETLLTTITLTEEEPTRTRVTVEWEVYGNATQAERDTFHAAKAGMSQGWGGSFDKLEDYVTQ